jgi:hypothetical protein
MNKILISGGRLRSTVFKKLEEWQSCDQAVLVEIHLDNGRSRKCVEYVSPPEACAEELPAILFKSGSIRENLLYACTSTEVLVYELPGYRIRHYISLPCFSDLHHVCPTSWGTLLVVVTGLDMVVEVSTDGKVVREWGALGQDPWVRFSRSTDYRKVPTTKPHQSHPNHAFELDHEVWVTRLQQRDAICLTKPGLRIDIGVQRPHDGYPFGGKIYFTLVDGRIAIANQDTLQVEQVIDLNQMSAHSEQTLGWCRGVLPVDEKRLWVSFTRVRPTKFLENVSWIKHGLTHVHRPSHLALYDLERGVCEREIEVEPEGIGVIFSLLPLP